MAVVRVKVIDGKTKINRRTIKELAYSQDGLDAVGKVGTAIKHQAIQRMPTKQVFGSRRGLTVYRETFEERGFGSNGAESRVGSRSGFAHLVEFGSINNPPYAPFRKAVDHLGLRLKGKGFLGRLGL